MTTRKTTISKPGKPAGPRSSGRLQRALDDTARREITAALKEADGNVSKAARALGVHRVSLLKRMRSLELSPEAFR